MSNKIETVSIGDLPMATELDDNDELLLRDASASLPEQATSRLSIATLRAAMGGGSPDRIESASGDAFVETTDDFEGYGTPGSIMRAESSADPNNAAAQVFTQVNPGNTSVARVSAGVSGSIGGAVGFAAFYSATSGSRMLEALGAPLEIEEPTDSNHAATKGYVDARPGADAWSEHAATQDVDLDGHKLTGLGEPTDAADAATKGYVDSQSGGSLESDKTSSTSVVITSSNTARVLELDASGDVAVEFPADAVEAIPVGSWGLVYAAGAGQVTFSAGIGGTVLAPNGAAKSAARYATIMWRKVAADTFALSGGLVP